MSVKYGSVSSQNRGVNKGSRVVESFIESVRPKLGQWGEKERERERALEAAAKVLAFSTVPSELSEWGSLCVSFSSYPSLSH